MMKIDGACHCGNITYTAEIDPENVGLCHCTDCQTLSGSAFRTSVRANKETFHLAGGQPKIYVKTAESGTSARPGILSRVWYVDLLGGRQRPASIEYPGWHGTPTSRAEAQITRVVPIRTRLGKWICNP